jgi:hypothetical protein
MPKRASKLVSKKTKAIVQIKKDYSLVWLAVAVRVGTDVFMLFRPLTGILLSIVWDIFDTNCFILGNFTRKEYHVFDKILDYIHYLFTLIIAYQLPHFPMILGWFLFRTVGHFVHFFTKDHRIFIVFPNVFEYLVIAELFFMQFSLPYSIQDPKVWGAILVFKVLHEVYVHLFPFWMYNIAVHFFPSALSQLAKKKAMSD